MRRREALLWLAALVLGIRMTVSVSEAFTRPSHGFVSHYAASRLLLEGADVARFYDDEWFKTHVARFEPTVIDLYGANAPTMSLVLLPLAPLDYRTARILWIGTSLLLAVGVLMWIAALSGVESQWRAVLLCLLFLYHPLYANLTHGQMYVLALALLAVAWWGYRTARPGATGAGLGCLFAAKTAALMYWPLLAIQRQWRPLSWGAGAVAVIVLASLPVVGVEAWRTYFPRAQELPGEPWLAVTNYQTVVSWFRHLFVHHPTWNPRPVLDLPALATTLTWLTGISMLTVSGWVAWQRRNDLVFGAFALLSLMLSPVSADAHYMLAVLPIVILVARLQHRMWSSEGLLVIAAALLIAADLPYRSPRVTGGLWALFAYPKLYGAFVLWALSLWLARRAREPHEPGALAT